MISDVLFEAVSGLDHYLNAPDYAETYGGPLRERILSVRAQMDKLRGELDAAVEGTSVRPHSSIRSIKAAIPEPPGGEA